MPEKKDKPENINEDVKQYVCGFLFDMDVDKVALIKKNKPEWQKGYFNGIGGKIEDGETALAAMDREFCEEAGLSGSFWKPLCTIEGKDWQVHFFFACSPHFNDARTMTDEEVVLLNVGEIEWFTCIDNLSWLVPLSIYRILNPKTM